MNQLRVASSAASTRPDGYRSASQVTRAAVVHVAWAAWLDSRPSQLRGLLERGQQGDVGADLVATMQMSGDFLKLTLLRDRLETDRKTNGDALTLIDDIEEGMTFGNIPPRLAEVVRMSEFQRQLASETARRGLQAELSESVRAEVAGAIAFLVGTTPNESGEEIRYLPESEPFVTTILSSIGVNDSRHEQKVVRWMGGVASQLDQAEAFSGVLPAYLGMGRLDIASVALEGDRHVAMYAWGDNVVARVSADPTLDTWEIEDFGPEGDRRTTSFGGSFRSAAETYARASHGEGQDGTTFQWLRTRLGTTSHSFLLIPPPADVTISVVPAVAMVHLVAMIDSSSRPPGLPIGRGSGLQPTAMPFGPRTGAKLVVKATDGTVRKEIPAALAEYSVPAIDVVQHIAHLSADPAVTDSNLPIVAAMGAVPLEFAIGVAKSDSGERMVLESGAADREYLATLHP